MKKIFAVAFMLFASGVCASEKVVVVPLIGESCSGNASSDDVLLDKTFSNDLDVGLVGSRPPAPLQSTGQTECWNASGTKISCAGTGQDGEYRKGIPQPEWGSRMVDNGDGTLTDILTGLIWLKNANCFNQQTWENALSKANALYDGATVGSAGGDCGLSDSSSIGDWRLPNMHELLSLLNADRATPNMREYNQFVNLVVNSGSRYWSSTTRHSYNRYDEAWFMIWSIDSYGESLGTDDKTNTKYVMAVRSGL